MRLCRSRTVPACPRSGRVRRGGSGRALLLTLVGAALAGWAVPSLRADVLRLANGGLVEGEIIEESDNHYKVRTPLGTVTVAADAVRSVERGPTVFHEYRKRLADAGDTPSSQTELAAWCAEAGLPVERRNHLERAIALDPEYEPARRGLGHVLVAGVWVDGRSRVEKPAAAPPSDPADEQARLMVAIQNQWRRRLRAIQTNLLDTSIPRLAEDGRRKIAAIDDPLSISPMAEVLSQGGLNSRSALVEALGRFTVDEATLNLGVLALVDPDAGVRRRALSLVIRRDDPRVGEQFVRALRTDNDVLVRRAAEGLTLLKYPPAVPDLIGALRVQRRKVVEVIVPSYFAEWQESYNGAQRISLGGRTYVTYRPRVSVAIPGAFIAPETELQLRDVTVFRTEVLEALVAITGQNFGFDEAAWRRWHEEQKP